MPLAGSDPRNRELAHVHWAKRYHDEGARDKALAHMGRALHYGVAHNRNRTYLPVTTPPLKTRISKPTRGEKPPIREETCSVCTDSVGPFYTHYAEDTRVMCKGCHRKANKFQSNQCSHCRKFDRTVKEYVDNESSLSHFLCEKCFNEVSGLMQLEERDRLDNFDEMRLALSS